VDWREVALDVQYHLGSVQPNHWAYVEERSRLKSREHQFPSELAKKSFGPPCCVRPTKSETGEKLLVAVSNLLTISSLRTGAQLMKTIRILTAMLPLMVATTAFGQQINATVNGDAVHFSGVQPMMINGRVMVPLRGVFEQMGAFVDWNPATHNINATDNNGKQIQLRVGEMHAMVDGQVVALDSPAVMVRGRTMVTLRVLSESMGAIVDWNPYNHTAAITTTVAMNPGSGGVRTQPILNTFLVEANTVIPFTLDRQLSSDQSRVGDIFTGTIDTANSSDYVGLPAGTTVRGHVDAVRAQTSKLPGVLSLAFDSIRLSNGAVIDIDGSLMGVDSKSIENSNGRMIARTPSNKNVKYVGIGAGAGALVAVVTHGNVITTAAIGAALGYLYDTSGRKPVDHSDVVLRRGSKFGVMMNRDQTFPTYTPN